MHLTGHFNPGSEQPDKLYGTAPPEEWNNVVPLPQGGTRPVGRVSPPEGGPDHETREFDVPSAENVRHIVKHVELGDISDNVSGGKRFIDWMAKEAKKS